MDWSELDSSAVAASNDKFIGGNKVALRVLEVKLFSCYLAVK